MSATTCIESEIVNAEPPKALGADRFYSGKWYVNADRNMWVGWGIPWTSGETIKKVMWVKPTETRLKISGRRIDADARPLVARPSDAYSSFGFEVVTFYFPTDGCWEITGEAGDANISFVTFVGG